MACMSIKEIINKLKELAKGQAEQDEKIEALGAGDNENSISQFGLDTEIPTQEVLDQRASDYMED